MGETTNIAWTDATWNCWQGCHKVSEACKNCYMFRDKIRYGQDPNTVVRSADATFYKPLTWAKNREKYGHIKRIFTCSWSDFFIEEADPWRDEAWDVIRRTPQFTYQILTKRPDRIRQSLPADWGGGYPNVWLGVTLEHPKHHGRVWQLLGVPAVCYYVSIEPMLAHIDLNEFELLCSYFRKGLTIGRYLDWVICGCESGPGSRETKLEWVRDLRDQCTAANVPFFLKQLMIDGKLVSTPELDGRKWTQFPNV